MRIIGGKEVPCQHLLALEACLDENQLEIFGEWTQSPDGWVNVHCKQCRQYYRVDLREAEPEEAAVAAR